MQVLSLALAFQLIHFFVYLKVVDVYKRVIVNILTLLYGKLDNVTQEMENLFQFETDLAKIMCKFVARWVTCL
jgi:tRNA G37 N-methylase Trm5